MRIIILLLLVFLNTDAMAVELQNKQMISSIIDTIASRDKGKISNIVQLPLERPYPVPNILTEDELVVRFDEVFDDKLINAIINSNVEKDWVSHGWRGISFNGLVWVDSGEITRVNYLTELEVNKKKQIISDQKKNLHETVRDFVRPILEWDIGKFHIRIDEMGNHKYRYASWSSGKLTSSEPDLVINDGEVDYMGSGGNHSYDFYNGKYLYKCSVYYMRTSSTPPGRLEVFKSKKKILSLDLIDNQ